MSGHSNTSAVESVQIKSDKNFTSRCARVECNSEHNNNSMQRERLSPVCLTAAVSSITDSLLQRRVPHTHTHTHTHTPFNKERGAGRRSIQLYSVTANHSKSCEWEQHGAAVSSETDELEINLARQYKHHWMVSFHKHRMRNSPNTVLQKLLTVSLLFPQHSNSLTYVCLSHLCSSALQTDVITLNRLV